MIEMDLLYMKELIQINRFSSLHNEDSIFFCKTDYLINDFHSISKLDKKVVLISGNSDYAINDQLINIAPLHNIKRWYAQNALSHSDILEPIPMGIENRFDSQRPNHGVGYFDRVQQKEDILNSIPIISPTKSIYSNFNIHTNYKHRIKVKNLSQSLPYIDWEEPNLSLKSLFRKYLDYRMILCPIGNGIDTHRLWEVLYCNRIPITIKAGNFKIYEMYEKFPIIILDNIEELYDIKYIEKKYEEVMNKSCDSSALYYSHWKDKIIYESIH